MRTSLVSERKTKGNFEIVFVLTLLNLNLLISFSREKASRIGASWNDRRGLLEKVFGVALHSLPWQVGWSGHKSTWPVRENGWRRLEFYILWIYLATFCGDQLTGMEISLPNSLVKSFEVLSTILPVLPRKNHPNCVDLSCNSLRIF